MHAYFCCRLYHVFLEVVLKFAKMCLWQASANDEVPAAPRPQIDGAPSPAALVPGKSGPGVFAPLLARTRFTVKSIDNIWVAD